MSPFFSGRSRVCPQSCINMINILFSCLQHPLTFRTLTVALQSQMKWELWESAHTCKQESTELLLGNKCLLNYIVPFQWLFCSDMQKSNILHHANKILIFLKLLLISKTKLLFAHRHWQRKYFRCKYPQSKIM